MKEETAAARDNGHVRPTSGHYPDNRGRMSSGREEEGRAGEDRRWLKVPSKETHGDTNRREPPRALGKDAAGMRRSD